MSAVAIACACADGSKLGGGGACTSGSPPWAGGCTTDGLTCGPGTHLEGSTCVTDALHCGAGTHQDETTCVPDDVIVACGPGTHASGGSCVPDTSLTCGAGTHPSGGECLPDGVIVTCGPGTHVSGTACVPDATYTCGVGTHESGGTCVPDSVLVCGAGTHPDAGRCIADATTTFEVRLASTTISADGYSKVPVLVLGRNADGTPSRASVILSTSRPGAGSFTPHQLDLGALGTTAFFTPCSATSIGCAGTVELQVSLATDPGSPVAGSGPVELVAPVGVGSTAPCLVGGDALFFDGNDYIFDGTQTVTAGSFSGSIYSTNHVAIRVSPSSPAQGLWWDLDFSTIQLGQPLAAQVYDGAFRYPFEPVDHPGLDVSGDGRGCNTLSGRFQIHELVTSGTSVTRFTATFEQHCEEGTSVLRGCVHIEP
jgi:hypothetical protein